MAPTPWDWNDNRGFDNWPGNRNDNRNDHRNDNRFDYRNNNDNNRNNNMPGDNMNFTAPRSAPPLQTPRRPAETFGGPATRAVNPMSMRNCMGRFTYIWLSNGQEFWYFPIQIWGNTVAGFRWDRRFGWTYTGISLNRVDMFTCSM